MLNIACLQKDTQLVHRLKDAVERLIWQGLEEESYNEQRKAVHLDNIYKILTNHGIEIDLATLGNIYNDVAPKDEDAVMKPKAVEAFAMKQYNRALRRAAMMKAKKKLLRA